MDSISLRAIEDPGPVEECDLCRIGWPVDELEPVEWQDSTGEWWERRFCPACRDKEGL